MTALSLLAETSQRLAQTPKRNEKRAALAACILAAEPQDRGLAALYLAGQVRQAKLGVGWAQVGSLRDLPPSAASQLSLRSVDETLAAVAGDSGSGSSGRRVKRLAELYALATEPEQRFLTGLWLGELRQGAVESLVVDAVAVAAEVPNDVLRRALMLTGDLMHVTEVAFEQRTPGLQALALSLFRPVSPMLAEPASDVRTALAELKCAAFEWKLDGARVQVHRRAEDVRVYSRTGNEVTGAVPEVVELALSLDCRELVLDGEVIALRPDGSPLPFQETMRRFGRKLDVAQLRQTLPLSVSFFDCLHHDGRTLLDEPTHERIRVLEALLPAAARVPRLVTDKPEEAETFLQGALDAGHEGVMAKALDAPYAAGKRGSNWLKLKRAHTLDLVVLAAEWGSGRRVGTLSNLHLGALDADTGEFVMLGKTFKGLTDELLAFQTKALLERETRRDAHVVYVRPELVVEIAFADIQKSPRYPGGFALRLARVKRYRPDKLATQASTMAEVRSIFALSQGPAEPA